MSGSTGQVDLNWSRLSTPCPERRRLVAMEREYTGRGGRSDRDSAQGLRLDGLGLVGQPGCAAPARGRRGLVSSMGASQAAPSPDQGRLDCQAKKPLLPGAGSISTDPAMAIELMQAGHLGDQSAGHLSRGPKAPPCLVVGEPLEVELGNRSGLPRSLTEGIAGLVGAPQKPRLKPQPHGGLAIRAMPQSQGLNSTQVDSLPLRSEDRRLLPGLR